MKIDRGYYKPMKYIAFALTLIIGSYLPSSSFAQRVIDPVRAMELCSHNGNLISYSSDCSAPNPRLRIDARHSGSSLSSRIDELEIYGFSKTDKFAHGVYYYYNINGASVMRGFDLIDNRNNIGTNQLETLIFGNAIPHDDNILFADVNMRGLTDIEIDCARNGRGFSKDGTTFYNFRDLIGTLSQGIKFDNRFTAYLEQYNFSKNEMKYACSKERVISRGMDAYIESLNSEQSSYDRIRADAEENVKRTLEYQHGLAVENLKEEHQEALRMVQSRLASSVRSLEQCQTNAETEIAHLRGVSHSCNTDLETTAGRLQGALERQSETISQRVAQAEITLGRRHTAEMATVNETWSGRQNQYEERIAQLSDQTIDLNSQINALQEQRSTDLRELSQQHTEQIRTERDTARSRETALRDQLADMQGKISETTTQSWIERLIFSFILLVVLAGAFAVSFVRTKSSKLQK